MAEAVSSDQPEGILPMAQYIELRIKSQVLKQFQGDILAYDRLKQMDQSNEDS